MRNPELIAFAREHLQTEQVYRQCFNEFFQYSSTAANSRCSDCLAGCWARCLRCVGERGVYVTTAAVETFVDRH